MATVTVSFVWTVGTILIIVVSQRSIRRSLLGLITFFFILELNAITSTAMTLGNQEINVSDLVLVSILLVAMPAIAQIRIPKRLLLLSIALLISVLVGLLWNLNDPPDLLVISSTQDWDEFFYGLTEPEPVKIIARSYLVSLRLALFLALACMLHGLLNKSDIEIIGRSVVTISKFHILYGGLELITKYVLNSEICVEITNFLFPASGGMVTSTTNRGGLLALQGFTREPSHFSFALFSFCLLLLLLNLRDKGQPHDIAWLGIACVLMISTAAFSSIMFLLCLTVFFAVYVVYSHGSVGRHIRSYNRYLITAIVVSLPLMFVLFSLIANSADSSNFYLHKGYVLIEYAKEVLSRNYTAIPVTEQGFPRLISLAESLRYFAVSPLIGVGIGTVNPYTAFGCSLATVGLVGTTIWFGFLRSFSIHFSGRKSFSWLLVIYFFSSVFLPEFGLYDAGILLIAALLPNEQTGQILDATDGHQSDLPRAEFRRVPIPLNKGYRL